MIFSNERGVGATTLFAVCQRTAKILFYVCWRTAKSWQMAKSFFAVSLFFAVCFWVADGKDLFAVS